MSGWEGDLSPSQENALSEFREALGDVLKPDFHTDRELLRWLRARNFDVKKSEKMFREDCHWRKQVGADDIGKHYQIPEVLEKYYPGGLHGYDKEGCPIYIETFGYGDIKGILHSCKKTDIIKMKIKVCEKIRRILVEQSEKMGYEVKGLVIIFDMTHYGLKQLWKPAMDIYIEVLRLFEDHYPETLKTTYVINTPRIFPIFFKIVRPLLDEGTKEKVHVLGGGWKEHILQIISPDQLPVKWGGTATDPDGDPHCRSKICMGGDVPKKYYIQVADLVDLSQFTEVTVGRGSSHQVELHIDSVGSVIRWQFLTEGKDIGFGVFLRTEKGRQKATQMEEIIRTLRVNSHMVPEDGSHTCDKTGTYVLRFDNTYSWVVSKRLLYQAEVLNPSEITDIHKSQSFINESKYS